MQFPIGVFGVAIATATLPAVSRSAARDDIDEFRHTLASSIQMAFLLTIPSAIGLIVLGGPIIALIYERGLFTAADTGRTADALAFYAIGLAGYAAIKILAPAFYALGDARKPMLISLFSILINFILNWLLVDPMRERGLALSTSIVALLNFILLYLLIRRRIKGIEGRATLVATAKIIAASIMMGGVCWGVTNAAGAWLGHSFWARLVNVGTSVGVGAIVFYACAWLLGVEQLKAATGMLVRRLRR
jgi:putative peptidoglycan lipid II flippase